MRIRTWLTLFFLPLFAGGTAYAFFDISAPFQRALMIANQATLIANQVAQLATMNQQLGKLTEQFTHIKDSTLGQVGAITQPFTDLASVPGQLIGTGMSWKSDFTGAAGELATAVEQLSDGTSFTGAWRTKLQQADQTSEQDILTAYADLPVRLATQAAENYRNQRERGEKSTVLNYAVSDAASEATEAIKSALDSYDGLRANANKSVTALGQAQVAGLVTQGQLTAAMAQLQAFQAAQEAAEELEAERRRRELVARQFADRQQGQLFHNERLAGITALSDGGASMLMRRRSESQDASASPTWRPVRKTRLGRRAPHEVGSDANSNRSRRSDQHPARAARRLQGLPGHGDGHHYRHQRADLAERRTNPLDRAGSHHGCLDRGADCAFRQLPALGGHQAHYRLVDSVGHAELLRHPPSPAGRRLHLPGGDRGRRQLADGFFHRRHQYRHANRIIHHGQQALDRHSTRRGTPTTFMT